MGRQQKKWSNFSFCRGSKMSLFLLDKLSVSKNKNKKTLWQNCQEASLSSAGRITRLLQWASKAGAVVFLGLFKGGHLFY
jgi:hypothetical protein